MEGESSTCTYDELESIILNGSSGPRSLPLEYLRRITNNFSNQRLLGEGGFGKVYKGVLQDGKMVAIKRLDQLLKPGVQERQFENEVYHLMRLKHPNIVRFLGYCYETQNQCVEHNGKYIFAEIRQKLICLEYLPNGSLDRHLSDGSSGYEWHTRYKIIKGICSGLLYLHEECQCQFGASIIHLDLKPGNILLDECMRPKIADFGLSRLFEDNKTQTCATFISGSLGYMAPEYLFGRIVTTKADIYNLGVIIIEIITGSKVLKKWRNRLGRASSETECKQIKCCLEIGLACIKFNREERPTSREIIDKLDRWETINCNVNDEKRPSADQILTYTEEKTSVSTTCYESIVSALCPKDITGSRRTAAAGNSNTNTGTGLIRSYGSRACGFVHRQVLRVMRLHLYSCLLIRQRKRRRRSSSLLELDGHEMGNVLEDVEGSHRHHPGHEFDVVGGGDDLCIVTPGCYRDGHPGPGRGFFRRQLSDVMTMDSMESRLPSKKPTEFTFAQMESATMGFSLEAKIGEGSFGIVYRGYLPDGSEVAIKRGESGPPDGGQFQESWGFVGEVVFLSRFRHMNLVGLVGYCVEKKERLLVCEYMKNGALYDHLHTKAKPSDSSPSSLVISSWKLRIKILLDASRGIEHLHSYTVPRIIHRDVKSSNIMLDDSWRARVSDFSLSTLMEPLEALSEEDDNDPEYHGPGVLADVYGFGVVMLESLTGRRAIFKEAEGGSPVSVVDYAVPSILSGELGKVLDRRAPEPAAHEAEAVELVAYTAVHCVRLEGKDRVAMADVVANLETAFALCEGNFDGDVVKSPSCDDSLPVVMPIARTLCHPGKKRC